MTELKGIAGRLSIMYRENTQLIDDGQPSEIRWPYTEMIYNITAILCKIDELHSGGNHSGKDYIIEKCDFIISYANDIKKKVEHGKKDDDPY
jgi:hypothetical protein